MDVQVANIQGTCSTHTRAPLDIGWVLLAQEEATEDRPRPLVMNMPMFS